MNLKERAERLKADIPAIFMALKHEKTPATAKLFAMLTIAYALSPIDFIPDFIPVLGYLDDLIVLPVLVALTIRFIPREVYSECRGQAQGMWQDGRPQKWYYAVPIFVVWLLVVLIILKMVL